MLILVVKKPIKRLGIVYIWAEDVRNKKTLPAAGRHESTNAYLPVYDSSTTRRTHGS
jgi:hypothetical protein